MNQLIQGIIAKPFVRIGNERGISITFPLKGYGKVMGIAAWMKKIYQKSVFHDFQSVLTSGVE
jgi:hypothetical protein